MIFRLPILLQLCMHLSVCENFMDPKWFGASLSKRCLHSQVFFNLRKEFWFVVMQTQNHKLPTSVTMQGGDDDTDWSKSEFLIWSILSFSPLHILRTELCASPELKIFLITFLNKEIVWCLLEEVLKHRWFSYLSRSLLCASFVLPTWSVCTW